MDFVPQRSNDWLRRPTLHPEGAMFLRRVDAFAQIIGVAGIVIGHGMRRSAIAPWEFGVLVFLSMAVIAAATLTRFRWSLARLSFAKRHAPTVIASIAWGVGLVIVTILAPTLPDTNGPKFGGPRFWGYVHLSELVLFIYSLYSLVHGLRKAASAGGLNPALLLVCSFLGLVIVGTSLLMLPICRAGEINGEVAGAPLMTALFTATSASCVTGLIVVDTGTYWSQVGQIVILILFQLGGLGIMTFSAFFAAIAGRQVRLSEFATLKELLASSGMGDVRRLAFTILGVTVAAELIGALALSSLWQGQDHQLFYSIFHSVSAFCNAGFALTEDSFVGMADRWEVAIVVTSLIIVGGLGFGALYNLYGVIRLTLKRWFTRHHFRENLSRVRMTLTSRLVITTTVALLIGGTLGMYLLERTNPSVETPVTWADAWFQSVTFRTAGFNTVDLGALQPSTKLFGIMLMVIGASPGSTGGGMKTVVFAIAVAGVVSVLRGRNRVETTGRTIPPVLVNRALAIFVVTVATIMITVLLLLIFEQRPEVFIDLLFEATSAVGTVGVSTSIQTAEGVMSTTKSLTTASQLTIVVAMFLGRVGPLTLLLALTSEGSPARYEYPQENVTLG